MDNLLFVMPRARRMPCTAVIGISSQIQRLKKMIGPMTEKTVFVAVLRHFSTHFCLWRRQLPRLTSAAVLGLANAMLQRKTCVLYMRLQFPPDSKYRKQTPQGYLNGRKTKSEPSAAGPIWKGKTTPSVNRTPPAAADDLLVLF